MNPAKEVMEDGERRIEIAKSRGWTNLHFDNGVLRGHHWQYCGLFQDHTIVEDENGKIEG